jgi:hypothetical protein
MVHRRRKAAGSHLPVSGFSDAVRLPRTAVAVIQTGACNTPRLPRSAPALNRTAEHKPRSLPE